MAGPHPDAVTAEAEPELEGLPGARQARVDVEQPAPGAKTEEAVRERLPHTAHGGEVEAAGGGAGEVVEVEPGGEAEQLEGRSGWRARAKSAAWMAGESELPCAVRGS